MTRAGRRAPRRGRARGAARRPTTAPAGASPPASHGLLPHGPLPLPRGSLPLGLGVSALLLLAGAYLWALDPAPRAAAIGGHWSLTRGDGAAVTDRDFRGRYVLLYFGYTACPDVCPTTLEAVADAMGLLGSKSRALQPLFVTVDPVHDTPRVVRDYVGLFDARLIGLTGTPAEIDRIEREYRIRSSVTDARTASGGRAIDHTAVLLLLGPDGRYLAPIPADASGRAIAARVRPYLS